MTFRTVSSSAPSGLNVDFRWSLVMMLELLLFRSYCFKFLMCGDYHTTINAPTLWNVNQEVVTNHLAFPSAHNGMFAIHQDLIERFIFCGVEGSIVHDVTCESELPKWCLNC